MQKTLRAIVFGLLIWIPQLIQAQYYVLGEDAAHQKWYSIETAHFSFVFPESFLNRAQELANQSEKYYASITKSISRYPKKIPVLIHTGGVVANAYSLWTPERTEYFMTPNQNNYAQNWLLQLIVHEDRHMIQMDKLNQGLTKILQIPFGQQSTALTLGLFMPMWYMEGDALTTETAFSESGRGRMPVFEMKMKAQILSQGLFSFEKASLGSYKQYVPDQYYFGYYYVAQSRKYYGPSLWDNAINNSARNWWKLNPLSNSFKKQTGLNKKQLYRKFFLDLKDEWLLQSKSAPTAKYNTVPTPTPKVYTHYKFPKYINDSTIVAEKSGMDNCALFVKINVNTGEEKKLFKAGFYASEELPLTDPIPVLSNSPGSWTTDNLSINGNWMTWAEKKLDPRWEHVSYSVVMKYNFETDKTVQLTHKTKYFSPVFSSDGSKMAVVEFLSDGVCNIVVINAKSGEEINKYPLLAGYFAMTPAFSPDGKKIVCITQKPDLKGLEVIDLASGVWTEVLKPTAADITTPIWKASGIYFNSSWSGIDNVYKLDAETGDVFQITFDNYGAYNIDFGPSGKQYVFSSYQPEGFVLKTGRTDEIRPLSLDSVGNLDIDLTPIYVEQEQLFMPDSLWSDSVYKIAKFRRGLHLFDLHSWLPVSINTDNYSLIPGVSVSSQNLLSTSIFTAGYEYLTNEQTGRFYANWLYSGWYPTLAIKGSFGTRRGLAEFSGSTDDYLFNESMGGIEIGLPLKTTVRNFFQKYHFNTSLNWYHLDPYFMGPTFAPITNVPQGNAITVETHFDISNREKTVLRDLQPRWGQDFSITLSECLPSDVDLGRQWNMTAKLFFPGLARHHSLSVDGGYISKTSGVFTFSDEFVFPRGYHQLFVTNAQKVGLNYRFPVWYPDFSIGSLFYFKRLKLNLFYDYANTELNGSKSILTSTGCEWTCDTHVFRFFIPLDIGFRYAYLPRLEQSKFEFLLGINFSGF